MYARAEHARAQAQVHTHAHTHTHKHTHTCTHLRAQFSIITEAPAFQFQSSLLARVSVNVVMNISMVLLALRLACYALLPLAQSIWMVLPVELLHGELAGAAEHGCLRLDNTSMLAERVNLISPHTSPQHSQQLLPTCSPSFGQRNPHSFPKPGVTFANVTHTHSQNQV